MKKRKWLYLALIVVCLAVYFGYRAVDRISTDTEKPEININGELEISVQDPKSALLQGVSARDKRDGDVTDSLVVESVKLMDSDGTVQVTYAAFDEAGNVAKAEREVRYTDYESPKFTLTAPLTFAAGSSFDVLSIIQVEDMLDGNISHRIRATPLDDQSITAQGVHDVEFRVTNSMGETVELTLPVEVYASGAYEAKLTLTDYLIYLDVGSAFSVNSYLKDFTRSLETVSLRNGLPEDYSLKTTGTVDTSTPGVYSVSYKVTYTKVNEKDSSLNQSYTGYSKLIVVVEG